MNTINDELVYKVHVLHSALNEVQKTLKVLEQENCYLKQKMFDLCYSSTSRDLNNLDKNQGGYHE